MLSARVLVVDDVAEIVDLVTAVLSESGHEIRAAGSGAAALALARDWDPEVVILDLALPDIDGVEVCRQLRTFSNAYVLMLSARSDEIDRVVGLTVGADDYVTKPFSSRELAARVNALMRRRRIDFPQSELEADEVRRFGQIVLRPHAREVCLNEKPIELTKIEFDILDALTEKPRRVLTRAQLRTHVWGPEWFGDDHAVDVHVSNLRKKLSAAGAPAMITTVRGVGYRISAELTGGTP